MFTLSEIDFIIIITYFVTLQGIAFFLAKKSTFGSSKEENYLLAGRKLSLPFFVASLVATWYGNILGIGEFVYRKGLVAWFCFGIVYYIAAFFYALLFTKKIKQTFASSIPEQIGTKFGLKAEFISSIILFTITFPAVYVLMIGILIQSFTGFNLVISIAIGTFLSLIYLYYGGFKANVITNTVQFVLMYVGFFALFFFSLKSINYDFTIFEHLPDSHKKFFGDESWQYILTWIIIALQTFIDPNFYQRCTSAANSKVAKKGIFVSILFWVTFDLLTISTGLISRALYPNIEPLFAYPILSENILPNGWKGLFIVSMISTIVSTMDSYSFLSGIIVGKHMLWKFKFFEKFSEITIVRIGLLLSLVSASILAVSIPSAIDIIYKTSSIALPSLLLPLILSFYPKKILSTKSVILLMSTSSLITLLFLIVKDNFANRLDFLSPLFYFEPMVIGIIVSIIAFLILYNKDKAN